MSVVSLRIYLLFLVTGQFLVEGKPYVGEVQFMGCYSTFDSKYTRFESLSPRECLASCSFGTYSFAAMKHVGGKVDCHCGNILPAMEKSRVSSKFCLSPCRTSDESCGNFDYFAVYIALPVYVGCFNDGYDRDLNGFQINGVGTMTNKKCSEHCHDNHHIFSGTQWSYGCHCGDAPGKYGGAPEIECDSPCEGNRSESCGGNWKNSIYSIRYLPQMNITYGNMFHCVDGFDVYGNCKSTKCQYGWKGKKCDKRDCKFHNGNCGIHRCMEFETMDHLSTECVCRKGYGSLTVYHDCIEIS